MSRTVSESFRTAFFAPNTGARIHALLEITHGVTGYDDPLRIVNNTEDVIYDGNTYFAVHDFHFDPPDQRDDGTITNARLTICAIDQQMARILRQVVTAATVKAVALYVPETGAVEIVAGWDMTMRSAGGDENTITAELVYEERLDNEFPVDEFTPYDHPGAF